MTAVEGTRAGPEAGGAALAGAGVPDHGLAGAGRAGSAVPDQGLAEAGVPGAATGPARWSSRRGRRRWLVAAVAVALVVGAAGYGAAALAEDRPARPALGPGDVTFQLDVEHTRFRPDGLRVVEGTRVRFVVVNGDPINHELIVGGPDVHARHADGTESEHPSIPGEVSVGPNGTAITTFTFDEPGTFEFACHLPGHYEYGMHGEVEVVPA
jgi:uncharacterized cupredoxin-like copper-binding protein